MTRILYVVFAVVIAFGIGWQAEAAQRSRQKAGPPPPPQQFKVDVATQAMAFQRLITSVPTRTVVGQFDFGFLCIGPRVDVYIENAFEGASVNDFISTFSQEATAAGYNIAGGGSDLFGSQSKPNLLVGGVVTALKVNGCARAGDQHMEATMSVEWQVFDPLNKKVLFKATNEGYARVPVNINQRIYAYDAARVAFGAAAKLIVADPNFVAAVKDPNGGPAPSGNSLFPEAATSAPTPTSTTQIARIPLSTTDFRAKVADIRQQVVTVLTPQGNGSGFYISQDLLLTNYHVIAGYTDVRVNFFGGRQTAGTVIASDARRDIALVRTERQAYAGLPLRLENPEVASQVFVIGSPLDPKNEGSVSAGIVSGFREHDYGPMLQSDVGVTFGNSGGPMFDDKGNVIALTDLGIPDDNGDKTQVNLFIPIADGLKKLGIQFGPDAATAQK